MQKIKDFFTNKQDADAEAFKEILRLALFSVISGLVTWLIEVLTNFSPDNVWVIVGLFVLRFIDKKLYASGVAGGLSRF